MKLNHYTGALSAALPAAIGAALLAALTLSSGAASANEFVRINGSTGCHPQKDAYFFASGINGLAIEYLSAVERHAGGLKVTSSGDTWVRCDIPSSSHMSHTQAERVKVYGHLNGSDNAYRTIKLCSLNMSSGGYSCNDLDAQVFNLGGSFTRQLFPDGEWDSPSRFPVVVMKLREGDKIRGLYVADH